jgi:hypothetical protein
MNTLTKRSLRPRGGLTPPSEAVQKKEREFWKKESGFYVRLLRQCESLSRHAEAEKYRNLIGQFKHFEEGTFQELDLPSHPEVTLEFNPLNQSYTRKEVSRRGGPDHLSLRERFQNLKEEAFQNIGRFFTVKIR